MTTNTIRAIMERIGHKADAYGIDSLPSAQQLVLRAWFARGVIGNGGFRYFLDGSDDLPQAAAALRVLGFNAAAGACEAVCAQILPRLPSVANPVRDSVLDSIDWSPIEAFEDDVFDVTWPSLEAAIAAFMAATPDAFKGI